jgi:hypothetical protein
MSIASDSSGQSGPVVRSVFTGQIADAILSDLSMAPREFIRQSMPVVLLDSASDQPSILFLGLNRVLTSHQLFRCSFVFSVSLYLHRCKALEHCTGDNQCNLTNTAQLLLMCICDHADNQSTRVLADSQSSALEFIYLALMLCNCPVLSGPALPHQCHVLLCLLELKLVAP